MWTDKVATRTVPTARRDELTLGMGKGKTLTLLMSVGILGRLPGGSEGEIPPPRSCLQLYLHPLVIRA